MCLCLNCGKHFPKTLDPSKVHCSTACRKEFNNRRALRGGVVYDLFMALRYERDFAKENQIWGKLCALSKSFKDEDNTQRAGRRSWQKAQRVIESNVPVFNSTMQGSRKRIAK